MAIADCRVFLNIQRQILNAPELSSDRKVEMLKECINDTLDEKELDENTNED